MDKSGKANIRVLLYVEGRYPTEKAYGVTTRKTVQSLERLGFRVFTMSFNDIDDPNTSTQSSLAYFFKESALGLFLRKRAYSDFGILSKIFWWITRYLAARNSLEQIQQINPTVIWMRDRVPATIIAKLPKQTKIVLELHQNLKISEIRKIAKLEKTRIVLAPISKIIESNLEKSQLNLVKVNSPMGVDIEMFKSKISKYDSINTNQESDAGPIIGYFGKVSPNGYSKGIEDLLELARLHRDMKFESKFKIVGPTENEVLTLNDILSSIEYAGVNISVTPHISHKNAVELMLRCDVLALPTVNSERYVGSPIKAIEYAATGKPILASRTKVNVEVFDSTFQPFWYEPSDISDMHEKLLTILQSGQLDEVEVQSQQFAETRTWTKRTQRIVEALNIIR
jgi:glycosyltransferase involved in cell wall biosynthesis